MNQKPCVIAIAAVSGGGMTTITKQLKDKLHNSKALYFDQYDSEDCPDNLLEWVEDGADYNKWNLTPLMEDIQILLKKTQQSPSYILLDYPFAYLNSRMGDYIDITVYIDTPLDVAMARRILRDYSDNPIDEVRNDLDFYLSHGRKAYLAMETVKDNSDIVINGNLSTEILVNQIIEEVRKRTYE